MKPSNHSLLYQQCAQAIVKGQEVTIEHIVDGEVYCTFPAILEDIISGGDFLHIRYRAPNRRFGPLSKIGHLLICPNQRVQHNIIFPEVLDDTSD